MIWPQSVLLVLLVSAKNARSTSFHLSDADKDYLMELDEQLSYNLFKYADKLEEKAQHVQRIVKEIRQPLKAAKGIEEEYLSNPLHSFPLIRHLYEDWGYLEKFMKRPVGQDQINFLKEKLQELPNHSNLVAATESITRIQHTYGLTALEMINGHIEGIQLNSTLTALDCFAIAKYYLKSGKIDAAADWLKNTKHLMSEDNEEVHEVLGLSVREVVLLLARCLTQLGQTDEAFNLLKSQPDLAEKTPDLMDLYMAQPKGSKNLFPTLSKAYSACCRNSHTPIPTRLLCRYNSTSTPFLKIAPLKMEEISLDPYVVVYHDVLAERAIAEVLRLSETKVEAANVVQPPGTIRRENVRSALGFWMPELGEDINGPNGPLYKHIQNIVRDITGLIIWNGQRFQVLKYEFGGHHSPHCDYFNMSLGMMPPEGDRIATVLFYLNDAPHGGATVFPDLMVKVPAQKGKVLFWHNLRGETHDFDVNTLHGACPVFHGTKLAMAGWIYEYNQMFLKPTLRQGDRSNA
ncbi:prolyl 4-hydroxylase subunit alpha-1-like [Drosophila bipectinata]|uniref:prolyl 4-hydroxylase subunit alpha-1-like n=1 Tax=Drosophila bipectinata TaxID=42026 RepID=UPI0038B3BBFC